MNLQPTFSHYFPEGSVQGECAFFAEKLVTFGPVGDTVQTKTNYVKAHGTLGNNCQVGDVLFFNIGSNGHVAIVNCDLDNQWQLTESNWNLDSIVHHTRRVNKNDSTIIGFVHAPLKVKIIPMFTAKIKLMANNCNWQSMPAKIAEIEQRLSVASQGRLSCQVDIEEVNLAIEYQTIIGAQAQALGEPNGVKIVDQKWFDQNIAPKGAGYNFVCLLLNDNESFSLRGNTENKTPIQSVLKLNENDTLGESNTIPMNGFVNTFLHEIFGHGMRMLTGQLDLRPDGTFLVHDFLQVIYQPPQFNIKFDLLNLLNLLDYNALNKPLEYFRYNQQFRQLNADGSITVVIDNNILNQLNFGHLKYTIKE